MTKPCTICRIVDVRQLYVSAGLCVLECNRCGLVYCDLPGTVQCRFTRASQSRGVNKTAERYISQVYESAHGFWIHYFDGLLQQLEAYQAPACLLDIGCGVGYLVEAAQNRGWEAYGLEISAEQAQYAREKLGLTVFSCYLQDAGFAEGCFDAITMHDVIEHVQDPRSLLEHVARVLRPGGVLMLETPNQDGLASVVTAWTHRLTLGRILLPIYSTSHIFRFSPRTMRALLESTGFQVLHMKPHDHFCASVTRVLFGKRWRWIWYAGLWAMDRVGRLSGLEDHLLVYARRTRGT